jgi:hypothetical protein
MKTLRHISSGFYVALLCGMKLYNIKPGRRFKTSLLRIFMLGLVLLLKSYEVPGGRPAMTEESRYQAERSLFYFQVRHEPFREDLLRQCLDIEKIRNPEIVLLQSRLETGFYTSDLFMNGNNLFGMKYPYQRPTVASGTYKGHAKYSHWSDSVIDYAMWQQWYISLGYRIGRGDDNDLYLVFLKCIPYAEDRRYISKLVRLSEGGLPLT